MRNSKSPPPRALRAPDNAASGLSLRAKNEKEGKKGGASKPGVWKRSRSGTILSKVSVGGGKFLQLKKRVTAENHAGFHVFVLLELLIEEVHCCGNFLCQGITTQQ